MLLLFFERRIIINKINGAHNTRSLRGSLTTGATDGQGPHYSDNRDTRLSGHDL